MTTLTLPMVIALFCTAGSVFCAALCRELRRKLDAALAQLAARRKPPEIVEAIQKLAESCLIYTGKPEMLLVVHLAPIAWCRVVKELTPLHAPLHATPYREAGTNPRVMKLATASGIVTVRASVPEEVS